MDSRRGNFGCFLSAPIPVVGVHRIWYRRRKNSKRRIIKEVTLYVGRWMLTLQFSEIYPRSSLFRRSFTLPGWEVVSTIFDFYLVDRNDVGTRSPPSRD